MRFYIASGLKNHANVSRLADLLKDRGHVHTYDWTIHGAVYKPEKLWSENVNAMLEVSVAEMNGVRSADIVIVLPPGGRGTHVELGAAIALNKKIYLVGNLLYEDYPCAFHYHPLVTHTISVNDLLREV